MPLPIVYLSFPTRESRSRFVHARFQPYLKESVLDVGCFEAPLRELLGEDVYTGVDIVGKPDITLDLDAVERLPFDDRSFHCVLCIEVLEHLDNLHRIFHELVRVSQQFVIVSLPNCWCDARQPLARGRGHFAHYGLPPAKPLDRHRWFFNLSEARQFVEGKAKELGLGVEDLFATEKPRNPVLTGLRRLRYPGERYQNRYTSTLWAVLRKG